MTPPDSPSPRTEAGKRLLAHWADELALIITKARFGPGVDMGGKHNPRPSERTAAQQFVEDFAAALQEAPAPEGLRAAIMDALYGLAGGVEHQQGEVRVRIEEAAAAIDTVLDILAIEAEAAQEAPAPEGLRACFSCGRPGFFAGDRKHDCRPAAPPSPAEPPRPEAEPDRCADCGGAYHGPICQVEGIERAEARPPEGLPAVLERIANRAHQGWLSENVEAEFRAIEAEARLAARLSAEGATKP